MSQAVEGGLRDARDGYCYSCVTFCVEPDSTYTDSSDGLFYQIGKADAVRLIWCL